MSYPKFSDQHLMLCDNTRPTGHRVVPCNEHSPWERINVFDLHTLEYGMFFTDAMKSNQ